VPGGTKSLAGPLGTLQLSAGAAAQGLEELLRLVGMITVNIGVLNLLPLPPLDGGRLLFLGYEKVRGKAPNRRVQEIVFIAGIVLLAFVLLLATKNDIGRIIDSLRTRLL
ncbi:MAG: site-2 protease family protein, partial [Planctomycetota bacterium]